MQAEGRPTMILNGSDRREGEETTPGRKEGTK